jgi:hypothetical protein
MKPAGISGIKREDLKDIINELPTHSKDKNIRNLYRGINEFKKGYQLRTSLVKDADSDLLADSYNILKRQKNCFSHVLNVHRAKDFMQMEIHTAEPLISEPSPFEAEIAIANLRKYKLSGTDITVIKLL